MPKSKLGNLAEMHKDIKEIKEQLIPSLDKRVAVVEVKSGLWGALSGLVGGALIALGLHK